MYEVGFLLLFMCLVFCFVNIRVVRVLGLIKTSFLSFIKFFETFKALFLKVIKSLLLLTPKALTLKDLTLENYSSPLSLTSENLLATASLTLTLIYYIMSFIIRAAIIIIRALRLRGIVMKGKVMNIIIIIKCFKYKKVRVI